MKKYSKLKVLNETVEVTPEIETDPEVAAPIIGENIGGYVREATILTIFEKYGIFLIKDKEKAVADALTDIEKIISVVYERGDITVGGIKHVRKYLDEYRVDTDLRLREYMKSKFFDHVLVTEMGELLEGVPSGEGRHCAEFHNLHKLEKAYNNAKQVVVAKYKKYVEKVRSEFLTSYGQLFDSEFTECFND